MIPTTRLLTVAGLVLAVAIASGAARKKLDEFVAFTRKFA